MATEKNMVQGNESTVIAPSVLTVRMIMQGKEVGSIIGKKGDNIKRYREESGAKINISDGSCPERIVTITGTTDNIHKAFTMICQKFEEPYNFQDLQNTPTVPKPPVTLRLVVPASQCGSLIGKGGIKIKEIRECTGASIQVASEMLPASTERAVTISGTAEAVTQCIRNVCGIMLESPPKGATIPYRPKPAVPPVVFTGGQAYVLPNQPMPMPPTPELNKLNQMSLGQPFPIMHPAAYMPVSAAPGYAPIPMPRMSAPPMPAGPQTHEMSIPNDLIGCIIGRGGSKINEIRQASGATIKISNAEDGQPDRKVTITGTPETIGAAQFLINTSMELHKTLTLDPSTSTPSSSTLTSVTSVQSPVAPLAIPMNFPTVKPAMQFVGLNGLSGLTGLNMPIMDPAAVAMAANNFTGKMRVGLSAVKAGTAKFAPY